MPFGTPTRRERGRTAARSIGPALASFQLRLRMEQERADRHGSPLGMVSLVPEGLATGNGATLEKVRELTRARLRATDWVGPVEDGTLGLLLPFTPPEAVERLAVEICTRSASGGTPLQATVRVHRPRPLGARSRRRPDRPADPETCPVSPDVRWEPRGVALLLARPLPRGKRLFDLVLSGAALVLLSPLMALIALAILVTSGRPVLFRQWRTGLGFRRFQILKFRTMRRSDGTGWEEVQHLNEASGPLFKSDHDPRVLRLGKFLRKTSLDELPQLWNVWLGDMTLVGPRALSPEPGRYAPWQLRRFDVTPGIACTWQAEHRRDTDFEAWMRSDIDYVDRVPSPWTDLRLLVRVVWAVLRCRGSR